jgi:hypothetical protein
VCQRLCTGCAEPHSGSWNVVRQGDTRVLTSAC